MDDTWIMSDTHFYHDNIIKFSNRPFASTEIMNETMVDNIHSAVKKNDTFIFLGDWSWNSYEGVKIWNDIDCKHKIFIKGNHDEDIFGKDLFDKTTLEIPGYLDIKIAKHLSVTLCHYPMLTWNKSHYGAIQLYGHHHGNPRIPELFPGKRIDVSVENWNYAPINLDTLFSLSRTLPFNWDTIQGKSL